MPGLSDEDLALKAIHGDRNAFGVLVDRYKKMVFTIAWRMLRNKEDAEDAAQKTFLRAFRSIHSFRGDARFSTWLYRISVNVCLSHVDSGTEKTTDATDQTYPEPASWDADPEIDATRADFGERVRDLVAELPGPYRTVITLYYLKRFSYLEIAEILELPMGTVKVHLHRAREMLRTKVLERYRREELL